MSTRSYVVELVPSSADEAGWFVAVCYYSAARRINDVSDIGDVFGKSQCSGRIGKGLCKKNFRLYDASVTKKMAEKNIFGLASGVIKLRAVSTMHELY